MILPSRRREGQAAIEDIKTVAIIVITIAVLIGVATVLGVVGSGLNQGFAHVDGARIYSGVAGLTGEEQAVTRLELLNKYDGIQVRGEILTLQAGFLEGGSFEVELPQQYSYEPTDFSGKTVCVIKQGKDFTVKGPPCR